MSMSAIDLKAAELNAERVDSDTFKVTATVEQAQTFNVVGLIEEKAKLYDRIEEINNLLKHAQKIGMVSEDYKID